MASYRARPRARTRAGASTGNRAEAKTKANANYSAGGGIKTIQSTSFSSAATCNRVGDKGRVETGCRFILGLCSRLGKA